MKVWYFLLAFVALISALPAEAPVEIEARDAEPGGGGHEKYCKSMYSTRSLANCIVSDQCKTAKYITKYQTKYVTKYKTEYKTKVGIRPELLGDYYP